MSQFEYHVDIALVIDATQSMSPVVNVVKEAALGFPGQLADGLSSQHKHVDRLRIRVILFRDLADNGEDALSASPFFVVPQDEQTFADCVRSIRLVGNTTFPESGLAGLSVAINSKWTSEGDKRRHVIVLWTDDEPHLPEEEAQHIPRSFRNEVAQTYSALTDLWESQYGDLAARRLILFAPQKGLWPNLADSWNSTVFFPSRAGQGLAEYQLDQIIDMITNSV